MGLKCHQATIFLMCYFSVVARHAALEAWYQVKPYVKDEWGWSKTLLGAFDSTFLL